MNLRANLISALILIFVFSSALLVLQIYFRKPEDGNRFVYQIASNMPPSPTIVPTPELLPESVIIPGGKQIFQTFNNCGPASMSMALSLYGIDKSQAEIGNILRPYQVANGDNDDKSVTLDELVSYAEGLGYIAYHRPYGTIDILKEFLANDIVVIARTLTKPDEDIGHYRVVKGYDDARGAFVQDDSLQGANLWFKYDDFNTLWEPYGYEYLVFVKPNQKSKAIEILGNNADIGTAWENALTNLEKDIGNNPDNINLQLSLSVAYYHTGNYLKSVAVYESIEQKLPFRALWYQTEPLLALQKLKRYNELLPRIENILSNGNRAFSELYQMRGEIYLDQGKVEEAKHEFELALQYNINFSPAKKSLSMIN